MTTLIWKPFRPAVAVRPIFQPSIRSYAVRSVSPAFDVTEDTEGYTVQAAIPGINPEDLSVELDGQVLTVKGEVKAQEQAEGVRTRLQERVSGTFSRSFRFSLPLNVDAVESSYEYGILTLRLPKAESVKPRRITVQAQPTQVIESQPTESQPVEQAAE